eukprot:5818788-Alexandrium_andersonii.AAC.1
MTSGGPRPRFAGSSDELATLLKPFVTKVVWCKYPEDGRTDGDQLSEMGELLATLFMAQPNMSFKDGDVKAAFEKLQKDVDSIRSFDWKGDEAADWVSASSERLRCACRHASQGLSKNCKAP